VLRKRPTEYPVIRKVFLKVKKVPKNFDFFGPQHVAGSGSRLKGTVSKDRFKKC
jgi:hypothetical protein